MNSMYDIQQLLIKYGIIVYTGDRMGDLALMEMEINELYESHMLPIDQYVQIKRVLQRAKRNEKRLHKG